MTRLVLAAGFGIVVGVLAGAALGLHAQEISPDVQAAADEAGVDPVSLLGAVYTTHLDPRAYLVSVGELAVPAPAVSHGYPARVRLTYYTLSGLTYCGGHPYRGSTACSWNFACGQQFVFRDGETVTCTDRGLLGSSGWLDIWAQPALVAKYGAFATVEAMP